MARRRNPSDPGAVDEYVAAAAPEMRDDLVALRAVFHRVDPEVCEQIAHGMPAMGVEGGHRLYFGAWTSHIGVYPIPKLDEALESEIAGYRSGKDALRFPVSNGVPLDLVERVVRAVWQEQ